MLVSGAVVDIDDCQRTLAVALFLRLANFIRAQIQFFLSRTHAVATNNIMLPYRLLSHRHIAKLKKPIAHLVLPNQKLWLISDYSIAIRFCGICAKTPNHWKCHWKRQYSIMFEILNKTIELKPFLTHTKTRVQLSFKWDSLKIPHLNCQGKMYSIKTKKYSLIIRLFNLARVHFSNSIESRSNGSFPSHSQLQIEFERVSDWNKSTSMQPFYLISFAVFLAIVCIQLPYIQGKMQAGQLKHLCEKYQKGELEWVIKCNKFSL